MKKTMLVLTALFLSSTAFADEMFTFECRASAIGPKGTISKLVFSEDGASLDGMFLDAADVGAFASQEVAGSKNKYVNGLQARTMVATVTKNDLKAEYDGYPHNNPNNIASRVYSVEVAVKMDSGNAKTYFGFCSQTYSGD